MGIPRESAKLHNLAQKSPLVEYSPRRSGRTSAPAVASRIDQPGTTNPARSPAKTLRSFPGAANGCSGGSSQTQPRIDLQALSSALFPIFLVTTRCPRPICELPLPFPCLGACSRTAISGKTASLRQESATTLTPAADFHQPPTTNGWAIGRLWWFGGACALRSATPRSQIWQLQSSTSR